MRRLLFAMLLTTMAGSPASSHEAELHTFHCLLSCPIGAPAIDDIVVRDIYTLASNDLTKMADWVAYRVTKESIGESGDRVWQADPWLSPDETLDEDAYQGASDALHIDRGHQAPLASFSGTTHSADTNILSNITPQSSALNQGAWVHLENQERNLATQMGIPVYVLTGPLYERMMRPLPKGPQWHRVPSGYWKVVALADGRATAFLFDQNTPRGFDYCVARVSLMHVELRSRLVMFPRMTTEFKPLDADLGCATPPSADPVPSDIPEEKKTKKKSVK